MSSLFYLGLFYYLNRYPLICQFLCINESKVLLELKQLKLYVTQDKHGKPQIATTIANKPAQLKRVFVTAEHKGLLPKVFYVEAFGRDLKTGSFLYEKFDN